MCSKEEVRDVLREEFNGDFLKELPVLLTRIDDTLQSHTRVHSDILAGMKEGFTGVNVRQDIANGRLKTNEYKIAYASGGLAIIALIAVPLLAWALFTLVNLQSAIQEQIENTLSHYEFEIVE